MSFPRVLAIGLDGGTFDLIRPWAEAGLLPNLARLMAEGCHGPLQSTLQPVTAPAWTTFMTGMNQGKHGLYDFIRRKAGEYSLEVTNGTHITVPTLFEVASQQGRRVVAINVPFTFPPRPVNGIMVSGPFAPAMTREAVFPPDYIETLRQAVPDYFILPDFDARSHDPLGDYAGKMLEEVRVREQLCLHVMNSQEWDIFSVVFMATDEVQHAFWSCMEAAAGSPEEHFRYAIREVYRRADEAIGKLLAQAAGDGREMITLIVSDHGAGPLKAMINLNRWLAEKGWLAFRAPRRNLLGQVRAGVVKRAAQIYRRYAPPQLRANLRSRLGAERFEQVKGGMESALFASPVDWEHTRVYALGAGGNVFINLQGREPNGMVAPGPEYEQLRDEVIAALEQMTDPETGTLLVEKAYRREELYHGEHLGRAADVVVRWKDYGYWGRGRYNSLDPVFERHNRLDLSDIPLTGNHRPEGILIAHGKGIRPGEVIQGARILDLAPTILSVAGIRPPAEMDGQILRGLFQENALAAILESSSETDTPSQVFDYSPEDAEKIADRLRSLGYM